jgi:hypothetical protein
LDLKGIDEPGQRDIFNQMPTRFSLTDKQVEGRIAAGGDLLRNNLWQFGSVSFL